MSRILPGVVMDAVAFLSFRQASETRQRATELYDRLRRDEQASEAVGLVAWIDDVKVRSAVKAQIALQLAGLQPNPIDLGAFLSTGTQSATSLDSAIPATREAPAVDSLISKSSRDRSNEDDPMNRELYDRRRNQPRRS